MILYMQTTVIIYKRREAKKKSWEAKKQRSSEAEK